MSQAIVVQQFQQNIAPTEGKKNVLPSEKLVIIYEKPLTKIEKKGISSVCKFGKVDSKACSESLDDLLAKYSAIRVDLRKEDIEKWYLEQCSYIPQHDNITCIYIAKKKETITDDRKAELKRSFNCKYVRKETTDFATNFSDLLKKVSKDDVSSHVVKLNKVELFMRFLAKCISL